MKKYLLGLVIFITIAGISFSDCLGADTIYFSCPGIGIYKYNSAGNGNLIYSFSGTIGGMAFDTNGNLYASQYFQNEIIKIASDGGLTTFASNIGNPNYMTYRNDCLYVTSNTTSGSVVKFDLNGNRSTYVSGLVEPTGLAFDDSGNLFVNCWDEGAIKKIDINGNISTFATALNAPEGLACDRNGNLYAANCTYPTGPIYKYDSNGNRTTFVSDLILPAGLAFDSAGYLYVGDHLVNGTINKIDSFGNSSVFASGLYGPGVIVIIPEPATIGLLALGGIFIRKFKVKNAK
jgi:sugar lactone lactonase YvrE